MKNISKYKVDRWILIPMILFAMISILTIYSAQSMLPSYMHDLAFRQLVWYIIGFGLAYFIMFIGNDFIYRNIWNQHAPDLVSCILRKTQWR